MSEKISTIILSSNESLKKLISLYLGEYGGFECFDDFSDLSDVYNTLSSQSKTFLIVDLNDGIKKYADFLQKTDFSNCRVLAISDTPEVDLIVRVMRLGVKEFLSSPIIKTEFFDVLKRVAEQLNGQNQKTTKSRMITVFSNKGGIGKTSVAANLAFELAKITKENVALVDLNFQFGDITTFMDLHPTFNISYMLKNPDKINKDFLLNTMEKYKNSSLYVLADPPVFKQAEEISRKEIENLISVLKETFSYIIVDAESSFNAKNITTLDNSDLILLVTVANLPALRNTQRCLELFEKLGYDREKTQIVVNRYMENDEIKESDVEKVLSKEIYWKIPNNYFAIMTAINKGIPVSILNGSTNIAQSYKELAQKISDNLYKQNMIIKFENILKQ